MEEPISSVFDELEQEQTFVVYADPGLRFLSFLIDIVGYYISSIVFGILLGIILGLSGFTGDEVRSLFHDQFFIRLLIGYFVYFTYYTLMEGATKGRTMGKLITNTVAIKEDLSPITWKDATLRTLSRMVPFEPFSMFNGYPWHDKWTNTRVIKKQSRL